jgi:hypothetical protein
MPVELACPGCQKALRAHVGLFGSDALCPFCRTVVKVPAGKLPLATATVDPALAIQPTGNQPVAVAEPAVAAAVDDISFSGIVADADLAAESPAQSSAPVQVSTPTPVTPVIEQVPTRKSTDEEEPLMPPSFDPEPAAAEAAAVEPIVEFDFEPVVDPTVEPTVEPTAQPTVAPAQPQPTEQAPAPGPPPPPTAAAAANEKWWAQTADGQQYGPVPRAELDAWVADGSINAECQLLRDGDQQWQWASQIYPQIK